MGIFDKILKKNNQPTKDSANKENTTILHSDLTTLSPKSIRKLVDKVKADHLKKFKEWQASVDKHCEKIKNGEKVGEFEYGIFFPEPLTRFQTGGLKNYDEWNAAYTYACDTLDWLKTTGTSIYQEGMAKIKQAKLDRQAEIDRKKKEEEDKKKKQEEDKKKKEEEDRKKKEEEDRKRKEEEDKKRKQEGDQKNGTEQTSEEPKKPTKEEVLKAVQAYVGNDRGKVLNIFAFCPEAKDCLGDPDMVCAIVQQYPQSIKKLPNNVMAKNLDEITDSFVAGVSDVCKQINNGNYNEISDAKSRICGGTYLGNTPLEGGATGVYQKANDIEAILQDTKDTYLDKVNDMCNEAKSEIELDQQLNGSNSLYANVNTKELYVSRNTGETEFAKQIDKYRDRTKTVVSTMGNTEMQS